MMKRIKVWFSETNADFKSFAMRQRDVLLGLVGLFILSYVAAHFMFLNSDAYALSEYFAKNNPVLSETLGGVNYVGLQPLANSIKWSNNLSYAELELNVVGSQKYCAVKTYLEKIDGEWKLLKAYVVMPNHDIVILKQ